MKGATKSLGQKHSLDKFYTKPEIAKECLELIDLDKYNLIIEPSAGNGSFSNLIPNCLAMDIEPENNKILKQDFFTYTPNIQEKILVIGNPPFGQQATLAINFFNHAADFSDTIAFILPKSFKKYSIQNKLNLYFYLEQEKDLPKNSFLLNNQPYDVPCTFQIWNKKEVKRDKIKLPTTSKYFDFTKDIAQADFRIQRVGGKAGQAFLDKNGALSSNYYLINKTKIEINKLIFLLNQIKYEGITDTVGPKSLPKGEMILKIEQKIKEYL